MALQTSLKEHLQLLLSSSNRFHPIPRAGPRKPATQNPHIQRNRERERERERQGETVSERERETKRQLAEKPVTYNAQSRKMLTLGSCYCSILPHMDSPRKKRQQRSV